MRTTSPVGKPASDPARGAQHTPGAGLRPPPSPRFGRAFAERHTHCRPHQDLDEIEVRPLNPIVVSPHRNRQHYRTQPDDGFAGRIRPGRSLRSGHGCDQPPAWPQSSRERAVVDQAQEGGGEGSLVFSKVSENAKWYHPRLSSLWYELWYEFSNLLFLLKNWRSGRDSNPRPPA